MKTVASILLFTLIAIVPVSAYSLYIDCPAEVNVGQSIKVIGNSSFPVGTSFDLVFYNAGYTATEIDRRTITLQEYNNKVINAAFPTKGLKGGQYKIEVQFSSAKEGQLSSDSVTTKIIKVMDRTGEITITAPLKQTLSEALRIEGSIAKLADAGVEIEVRGPEGPVFGPTWIATSRDIKTGGGTFAKKIPISVAGDYDIHFTDAKGYIGYSTITVAEPVPVVTAIPETTQAPVTTRIRTTATTPVPEPTKSPVSPITALLPLGIAGSGAILLSRRKTG